MSLTEIIVHWYYKYILSLYKLICYIYINFIFNAAIKLNDIEVIALRMFTINYNFRFNIKKKSWKINFVSNLSVLKK